MSSDMLPDSEKFTGPKSMRESSVGEDEEEELYYGRNSDDSPRIEDLTTDRDVLERIRSRGSVTSDVRQLNQLREKYPEGQFHLDPDDPRRPQNWAFRKRILHTMAYGFTTFSAQVGSSAFSPATGQLCDEMHKGAEVGTLAFSIFLLGNMMGTLLFTPLSEMFGRKVGVFIPFFVGGAFHCVCANANSMPAVVVFRFLAGVFASAPISNSGGAMADMWKPQSRAAALVLYGITVISGAAVSPILGALLVDTGSYGWRWTEWLGGILGICVAMFMFIFMSESYLPVIEQKLARHTRLDSGFWGLHSDQDKYTFNVKEILKVHLARPILMLGTPIVTCMVMYASFTFGLLFILITTIGENYQEYHHFTRASSLCPLIGFVIGYLAGCSANVLQSRRYARLLAQLGHQPPPEQRLPAMMLCGWALPAGMFMYGWTMRSDIHWIVPTVGLALVGAGLATIFQGCLVYLTDVYTKYAASAVGANTFVRSIFGGVFPLFARQMYHSLHVGWASSVLGFVGAALVPVPWFFYFFGPKIREHDPFRRRLAI